MFRPLICFAALGAGCADDPGDATGGGGTEPETIAPPCDDLTGADPKQVFTTPVVPNDQVLEALIFGGMDPGTLEPINFELGFRLNDIEVPVVAPADLYVRSVEYSEFTEGWRAGETDYGFSFHVCSDADAVAVEGDFAHMTALAPDFAAILEEPGFDCEVTAGAEETVNKCRLFYPVEEGLVIEAGTLIGSAGGTGLTDYAPGFDFNLLDTRYPINYANPDRLGSETGPGRPFRYGACLYEYFTEPTRSEYLAKVGQNGEPRVSEADPCGTLEIDKPGSAGGIWILADQADLTMDEDLVGVLEALLVLAPHPIVPTDKQVVSTEMTDLASWKGEGLLVEFEPTAKNEVNVSIYDTTPGTVYCIDATGLEGSVPFSYYLELIDGGDTLVFERLDAPCGATAPEDRAFGDAALTFVR